jgi:hypothetical protein
MYRSFGFERVVGEHSVVVEGVREGRGLNRKANVGISNDKWRGKLHRRKTKGSLIYVHRIRVSRGLRISRRRSRWKMG